MLKLKLQYFGHLMQRTHSLEKILILGKTEGRRRRGGQSGWIASPTQWTWVWASSGSWWWTGKSGMLQSVGLQRVGHDWVNWTERRRTKKPLDESERGEWKTWLKTGHSKNSVMTSSSLTSWQIDGETMETVTDFILGGSKITADDDWSHEIERHLLLEEKLWPT